MAHLQPLQEIILSHIFAAMTAKKEVQAMLKATKWSRWMLADRAGVPTSTVSRILDHDMDPRHSTMEKLRSAVAAFEGAKGKK